MELKRVLENLIIKDDINNLSVEELTEKYGKDILNKIAKKNFSNTSRILKTRVI